VLSHISERASSLALWSLFCVALLPAQETVTSASVSGRVTDPSGAVVQGAAILARRTDTNTITQAKTDRDGRFRFPYLPIGPYTITVQQAGFAEVTREIRLTVGAAFEMALPLTLNTSGTVISVTDQAPLLESARSQIATTIAQNELQAVPLNGRNFLDLALLTPGVSATNTGSNQLFAETSAAPGQGISVNSQRNFSNSFIVDGLSANDDAAGLVASYFSLDVVNEFQVVTSGGQAEFGRALGGYVNMVTRSGTNTFHGDLYGFFRNQRLNANNALTNTKLPMTQAQYGTSVGGPILRDRTFFFANFERRDLNQTGLITISPANVDTINNRLIAAGYPGPLVATGLYPNPVHSTNFLAKLDHQFSAKDQFNARYSLYRVDSQNTRGAGALNAASASAGLTDFDQTVAASNILTLSPQAVNETRAQFTYSNLKALPTDPLGPAVSIAGIATFGTLSQSPTGRLNKLYELVDNLSYQTGSHAARVGVDFLYNDLGITFPRALRGSYAFASLSSFENGIYNNTGYTQTFGNSFVPQTSPNFGIYAQDEWKLAPNFTLNAGVRYDLQFLQSIRTDRDNFSPRAGFAWTPFASRRTVIRGSFGLFYDRVPLRALANALLSSANTTDLTAQTQVTVSLSPTQTGAPLFPGILTGIPGAVLPNFTTMDRNLQNAYSEQGSLEIQHQLGQKTTLSVNYQHVRGVHLLLSVNQNVPSCRAVAGNNGCRPNPAFGNNSQYSALGDSQYDGVAVSLVGRPNAWATYRLAYTYSKALDNVGEFFFSSPLDNFNIWRDWGRSDDDQRHRVVFDGTLRSPQGAAHSVWQRFSHGFSLSGILQYYSPLPFNVTTGATTLQGTSARPVVNGSFIGRNTGIGFDSLNVSARLSRSFAIGDRLRIEAMAESFNALNHRNNLFPNATFGSGLFPINPLPAFGRPTAVADPRNWQLALRMTL